GQGLRCLTAHLDRTMGNATLPDMVGPGRGEPQWSPDGRFIYVLSSARGFTEVLQIDVATGEARTVAGEGKAVYAFRLDRNARRVAFTAATLEHPGELYLVEDGREERLSAINDAFFREVAVSLPIRYE